MFYVVFVGEADQYFAFAKLLEIAAQSQSCKTDIAASQPMSFLGVDYHMGPQVIMYPDFAIALEQVKHHIKGANSIKISHG